MDELVLKKLDQGIYWEIDRQSILGLHLPIRGTWEITGHPTYLWGILKVKTI